MSNVAIRVEGLSKLYRIGAAQERHNTLRDAVSGFFRRRPLSLAPRPSDTDLWALKDVSFEVKQGEVVGIIGRNGAGKSTLLKILSRITQPTSGRVALHGRVASLLEVGTGFHPELTGRENIYLNGAILGMKRREIDREFDEIVTFAEIERFLDTPVKRYSSGMYVRLAFAVAAHLDPEILVVDEVLAVGDVAFQQKCLGQMQQVAKGGRTVLFVSHNMAAIQNLCNRGFLLRNGSLDLVDTVEKVIATYLEEMQQAARTDLSHRTDRKGSGRVRFVAVELLDKQCQPVQYGTSGQPLTIRLRYECMDSAHSFPNCRASINFKRNGHVFFLASTELTESRPLKIQGHGYLECTLPRLPLSQGTYWVDVFLESGQEIQDWVEAAADLPVVDGDFYGTGRNYPRGWAGAAVLVEHTWTWQ